MALKLLQLTQFPLPNLSIYSILQRVWVSCDRGRFFMHNPFIEKSMDIGQRIISGGSNVFSTAFS